MGEKKHINEIPPKIPGQSLKMFVYVFFPLCALFSLPIIMHLIADTDADNNYLGINFSLQIQTAVLCVFEGGQVADQNCFGHNFSS